MFKVLTNHRYREIQCTLRNAVSAVEFAEKRANDAEEALKEFQAKPTKYCSFCAKSQYDVTKLIAGPTALICDECAGLCMQIILENRTNAMEA
jgi:hypothetical protein